MEHIRQALSGRLGDVRELLRATTGPVSAPPRAHPRPEDGAAAAAVPLERGLSRPAGQPEEALRRLLVSILARVRDRRGPGPDRVLFFALLFDLETAARSEDLRFLDAWNSACEVLLTWPREELARDDAREALQAYASLLEMHLLRMGGRS